MKIFEIKDFDFKRLSELEFDGIDWNDAHDFTDSYLSYGLYDGEELTDDEMDWLHDNYGTSLHSIMMDKLY